MKKLFLIAAFAFAGISTAVNAQDKKADEKKAAGNEPNIQFTETTFDFGAVEEGPDYTHAFKFKNTGKSPLIINNVNTPCGCTSPGWSKEPIMPGKTGEITATFHSAGRLGQFTKTLSVQTNMGDGKDQFVTIRGEVKQKGEMPAKAASTTAKPDVKVEKKDAAKDTKKKQ